MDEEIDLPKPVMVNWKKVGLYVVSAAIIVGVLVARLGTRKTQSEKDFVTATAAFTKWSEILDQNSGELAQLEKIVKKHPELHAQYDGRLGQSLLAAIAPDKASSYIERVLDRTKQPYYQDYSQTSLKITQGSFQEAFQEACALKEKMTHDRAYWEKLNENSALYAFNLLRIAVLSQKIGDGASELSAWEEIKSHSVPGKKDDKIGHAGFKQLFTHFTVQEATLLDYIKTREEDLRKS